MSDSNIKTSGNREKRDVRETVSSDLTRSASALTISLKHMHEASKRLDVLTKKAFPYGARPENSHGTYVHMHEASKRLEVLTKKAFPYGARPENSHGTYVHRGSSWRDKRSQYPHRVELEPQIARGPAKLFSGIFRSLFSSATKDFQYIRQPINKSLATFGGKMASEFIRGVLVGTKKLDSTKIEREGIKSSTRFFNGILDASLRDMRRRSSARFPKTFPRRKLRIRSHDLYDSDKGLFNTGRPGGWMLPFIPGRNLSNGLGSRLQIAKEVFRLGLSPFLEVNRRAKSPQKDIQAPALKGGLSSFISMFSQAPSLKGGLSSFISMFSRFFGLTNKQSMLVTSSGTRTMPLAKGGVVSSPTRFPIARGKLGLMGEAGPEAIMPLSRGPDGRLGISAHGGTVVNRITFNITTPDIHSFRQSQGQLQSMLARAAARGRRWM